MYWWSGHLLKFIQDVIPKTDFFPPLFLLGLFGCLPWLIWGDIWNCNKERRIKKPVITGLGNPTDEDIPNGAQTATQSDMGAELGESPGHASEVKAFI
jgi:hypothetical protein